MRHILPALAVLLGTLPLAGCAAGGEEADDTASESDLVGGARDQGWSASGYLVKGPSMDRLDLSRPACGATLIAANVVVTAAHCVPADDTATYAFGTGDVGAGPKSRVIETHVHPEFHPTAQGSVDLVHALRKYDIAYLVLESAVAATPATLAPEAPSMGCDVQAIGYGSTGKASGPLRKSTPACIMFRVTLKTDPIFEVHPRGMSALCTRDGDEGSSVVRGDPSRPELVGIYVGSVTGALTDCVRGTQFLNGYESAFGYRDFFAEGIKRGAVAAKTTRR